MVASGSRTMIAGSLSSCIAGFLLSCRFLQSSGPRHSCVGTGPAFAATGVGRRAHREGDRRLTGGIWQNIEKGSPDLYKMAMSLNSHLANGNAAGIAAGVVFVASPVASRIS